MFWLQLIPSYRGVALTYLSRLSVLDDIVVTPDERHAFRGLLSRQDLPLDFAKIRLELRFIRNLPVPEELLVCSRSICESSALDALCSFATYSTK